MLYKSHNPPIILTFSALDPSGSGGIQADIETAASLGCHCAPIITSLCTDGATQQTETIATDPTLIIQQARSVLESMQVRAIKIGYIGSTAIAEAVHSILSDYPSIPVILHPVLALWDDEIEEQADLPEALSSLILPLTSVACVSLYEARKISQEADTLETTAGAIVNLGCNYLLITSTGKERQAFQNSVFGERGLVRHYYWEQEAPHCHGSSTTLAMSIAAYMAHGSDEIHAIEQAQNFTWQTMRASRELGFEKSTPHRFFWADKNIETPDTLPVKNTH